MRYKSEFNELHWCRSLAWSMLSFLDPSWEPLSCRRKSRKLTTFYKMHNRVCPQYLCNCLPPTVSSISDHNLRNNENYTTPRSSLKVSLTSFIPSTVWTLLKILEFPFILISSFPKSNVSIFLLVSLKFLKRQYLSF
jgi:hypothetical protein